MKKLFAMLSLMTLVLAISPVSAFAAGSPLATTVNPSTTDDSANENPTTGTNNGGNNESPTSPKTGSNTTTFAFALFFTAAGLTVIAKKKLTD